LEWAVHQQKKKHPWLKKDGQIMSESRNDESNCRGRGGRGAKGGPRKSDDGEKKKKNSETKGGQKLSELTTSKLGVH